MDRLVSLEPSNLVVIRVEPGQRWRGELTLRNVMYTMPVAFRLDPMNRSRYSIRPQSGIISPLGTITMEITYLPPANSVLPDSFPHSPDSFLLHSVVAPGASAATFKKDTSHDPVPSDWFTTKKKQVFTDSAVRVVFVGSAVLTQLVTDGTMDELREALERSEREWRAADSVDQATGESLLHLAIARRRPDLVQLLLEFGPDVEAAAGGSGTTPLEAAAAAGDALIVELLLARKASTTRSAGSALGAPIHLASASGHSEVLRLLLLKGVDLDALTADGKTALLLAVEKGHRDCALMLLAAGCRPEIRSVEDGLTALHVAASAGDEAMVKLLLRKGGWGMREVRDRKGRTAYDAAAEHGHSRLYDVLRLGNMLAAAARKGEARAVCRLVEGGAAVDGRDQNGWTALMRAAFKGRTEAMRALLEKGAEVGAADREGYTALHCAVEAGQAEAVELLVKKGADVDARTRKGATAVQIAASLGYAGIHRILVQGGAVAASMDGIGAAATAIGGVRMGSLQKARKVVAAAREKEGNHVRKGSLAARRETSWGWNGFPVTCSH